MQETGTDSQERAGRGDTKGKGREDGPGNSPRKKELGEKLKERRKGAEGQSKTTAETGR